MRPPVVTGVTRGAGTSTLAAALHAVDGGVLGPGDAAAADVLVCGADEPSLRRAAALAPQTAGPRPVLVLTGAARPARTVPAGRFGAVLALPRLRRWVGGDARAEAAAVLAYPPERLPPDVRAYAAALHRIVSALLASGQLQRATPPAVAARARSTPKRPWAPACWPGPTGFPN
ncbi:MAG TPA: hypothetical protein VKZ81_17700 [Pseudonocardia sp.]|uniref:hypothetical protein n=1 Tax=Pseudonocardia sp. TaxID=60912 RepID=UPI002B4AF525|nr:hypothetical protein [Pseudonocardia sp.]HLU57292.1 hypothetical protein [Pseudonocardia sp.]